MTKDEAIAFRASIEDAAGPNGWFHHDFNNWALIRAMARSIPSSVDLTDYAAVVHALHRARFVAREFCEPLDEVIADARRLREVEALEGLLR